MTTPEQINEWIASGESEVIEFKNSTGARREAVKTLCAMLNSRGGSVIFGVDPEHRLTGQLVGDQTIEHLAQELRLIDPPVTLSIDRVPVGEQREALVVTVSQGPTRPYTVRGCAFQRVGNTTVALTQDQYNLMLMERLHGDRRWEIEPADGWEISDLDTAEITRTIEEAIRRRRQGDPGTRNPVDLLRGFGLMRDGVMLRAAAMLFGRDEPIESRMPQCLLRVARFRGTTKTEFIDNRQFYGNAFRLLVHADKFLRSNLPVAGRVEPGLFERADDPLYPPIVLREALANAICHRDYTIGGGSVAIAIFDDRLEITSSGVLHFGLTVEDLYRAHDSLPWNPLIARVFYQRGIVEQWGRGTIVMSDLTQQAGLPRPEIEVSGGCVTIRFRPSRYVAPETVRAALTQEQRGVLQILVEGGHLALREIKEAIPERPEWAIKEDLARLKSIGLIQTAGHGRGAYWYRTNQLAP